MIATNTNFDYWRKIATIKISEVALMMYGYDPRARGLGYMPVDQHGDEMDLSDDHRLITSAVLANELEAVAGSATPPGPETHLTRSSLIPWLRSRGYDEIADGLEMRDSNSLPSSAGARDTVTGPMFSMKRAALIKQHQHQWPTIEADLADASKNQLNGALAGPRDWYEAKALEWARSKGKLVLKSDVDNSATNVLSNLPSKTHRLAG